MTKHRLGHSAQMSISACPIELLALIVNRISDDKGLRVVRAVDRMFCALATPLIFQRVYVKNRLPSAQNLAALMEHDEVAQVVKTVVFHWCNDPERVEDTPTKESTYIALEIIFSHLHLFPALVNLELNLCPDICPQPLVVDDSGHVDLDRNPSEAVIVESTLLQALLRGTDRPHLKSLAITNLSGYPYKFSNSQDFVEVLSSVEHLHIGLNDALIIGPCAWKLAEWMWLVTLPDSLLGPTQARLMSLTLVSHHVPTSFSLLLDFSTLFFPVLHRIKLDRIALDHHRRIEDFIVAHGRTLRTLVLDSCPMRVSFEGGPPRPWHLVCNRFAETLEVLVDVQFHSRDEWYLDIDAGGTTGDLETRLLYLFGGLSWEYGPWEREHVELLDRIAIEHLLAKVEQRRLGEKTSRAGYAAM
ncbi:hypothetical protein C8Q70DRAFT_81366 [Cubamyces menziesii]|nr:hypothetical protein C8Q70DRAFT_81366 [Cubamyces menziesii]